MKTPLASMRFAGLHILDPLRSRVTCDKKIELCQIGPYWLGHHRTLRLRAKYKERAETMQSKGPSSGHSGNTLFRSLHCEHGDIIWLRLIRHMVLQ